MSCRRGVPKNDCSCCKSLAEKVRELWERAANAIKTINGVQADGVNNFDILPGAGIQVNPRANGIEIVATGASPEGLVQSVNGETPDEDGNVEIDTGLLTVNTIAPDADGEFSITAGSGIQINAGDNGIEIENTSQGAVYTGIAPIQISADNEISLKDFTLADNTQWRTNYVGSDLYTKYDILLQFRVPVYNNIYGDAYAFIPKGTYIYAAGLVPIYTGGASDQLYIGIANLTNVIGDGAAVSGYMTMISSAAKSGSGINETISYSITGPTSSSLTRSTSPISGTQQRRVCLYYR